MKRLEQLFRDPVTLGFWTFTLAVAVQVFHQVEHFAQLVEKHRLEWPIARGVFGAAFDFAAVHSVYNASLFLLVSAVWIVYFKNPGIWRKSSAALFALTFAWVFQGYHLLAYWVRIRQSAESLAARSQWTAAANSRIEFDFLINTLVVVALLVAYGGFRPSPAKAFATRGRTVA